ncbi:hypothetical protein J3R82DRAFT_6768 [Butyriboletus roseoflavus]|nr:hypothetical protein J3R82DRAFT_6768 [Butyriboletus roseoflavus]
MYLFPTVRLLVHTTLVPSSVIHLLRRHRHVHLTPSVSSLARAVAVVSLVHLTNPQPAAYVHPLHPAHHVRRPSPPVHPFAPNPSHVAISAKRPATGAPAPPASNKSNAPAVAALRNTRCLAATATALQARIWHATSPARLSAPAGGTSADASAAPSLPSLPYNVLLPSPPSDAIPYTPTLTLMPSSSLTPPRAPCTSATSHAAACSRAGTIAARGATTGGHVRCVRGEYLRSCVHIHARGRRRRVGIRMCRMRVMKGWWLPVQIWRMKGWGWWGRGRTA